ncbi:MFS transporter [Pseudomonas sp. C2B4]|uniref:MFS transporter n=1 Tax=Pseudomonas sp. C2B4 TaxID=2735270 RepID=UPI001586A9EF|nr:MFS transporter [Pseudomonas sp. C2B4]NUU38266.1 MFS transporter [Pseudomonas sp. C2B4]
MTSVVERGQCLTGEAAAHEVQQIFRKIAWRLLPFLFVAYVINSIDRINISFAKLRMAEDLALSDAAYGLGAAVFFVGYLLFEVPSNLYMQRVGARLTIMRIMMLWGLVTIGTSLVSSATGLYIARFLLGVAEAGFFPGVILYLTYWFPASRRGRITSIFIMAGIFAGIVSGPLAGWIMTHFHGWAGLRDWQVLFVFEGIPAVLLGLFAWFWLVDKPQDAPWLNDHEKAVVQAQLEVENVIKGNSHASFRQLLRDPRVLLAGLVFFCIYSGTNTVAYWMPSLIQSFGLADIGRIGLISSLPYCIALVAMYLLGRSSDKHLERRWHLASTMLVGAGSFVLLGLFQGNLELSVLFMSVGAAACLSAVPLFWTIPPAYLSGPVAAGGIALISSLGGIAAMVAPVLVGAVKTQTGSLFVAFDVIAGLLVFGATVLLLGIPAKVLHEHTRNPI